MTPGFLFKEFENMFPFQCLDAGELRNQKKISLLDFGTQTLTSPFDLLYDTVQPGSDTDSFSLNAGTGELTINQDGDYFVTYNLTMFDLSGSNQIVLAALQLDTGGGFAAVPGMTGTLTILNGTDQVSRRSLLQLSEGDIIKLNVSQFSGTNTAATLSGASSLTVESLRDETEDDNFCVDAGDFDVNEDIETISIDAGEL